MQINYSFANINFACNTFLFKKNTTVQFNLTENLLQKKKLNKTVNFRTKPKCKKGWEGNTSVCYQSSSYGLGIHNGYFIESFFQTSLNRYVFSVLKHLLLRILHI